MPGLKTFLASRKRNITDRDGFTSLLDDPSSYDAPSPMLSPIPARIQSNRRIPQLVRIGSNSTSSSRAASPAPSPSLSALSNPFDEGKALHYSNDTLPLDDYNLDYFSIGGAATPASESAHYVPPSSAEMRKSLLAGSNDFLAINQEQPQQSFIWRALEALRAKIYQHFDPHTFWSMIDIREIFWPFTWKKYGVLLLVALAIAAIVVTEQAFHWIQQSMEITRRNMLPVLILVIGLEPMMIVIILMVAKIPDISSNDASPSNPAADSNLTDQMAALEKEVQQNDDYLTALVIPCHNSDHEAMKRVLESAYPHFRPQDIFIVDNGRSMYPKDNEFREFIYSQHPDINYIWSPIGSKNAAQLVGAMAARNHQYIMTVDDDVCIPTNFRAPLDLVNEKTKGVAFPLKATDANGNVPVFMVAWQDCEYRMAGLTKLAESQICGVLFPHGAGWFCERETLIDLISNYHSIDFIAEDVNTGVSMQKMNKLIAFDTRCVLETEVPSTIFGQGLNWYHQRVRSWEMGRHGRLFAFIDRLFFSLNGQRAPWAILAQKFVYIYSIACIVIDWIRVPVIVTMGTNGNYWRQAGLLTLASILPLMWFRYISCRRRPDLRPTFWGSLTIPVYKQLYALVSIIGAIRSVVYYFGGHKLPKTIKEMVADKDERCLWLDPRFETNPGFLADEGLALTKPTSSEEKDD
ncbi:uncharacterized protein PV09_06965 [Verruconis gallopava]|uniref:Uncharacterized protein n=1 Tax=Verruconis gallopava TaxID=253628 RepID=A0A0D2A4T7_9PEZI|nr:uncharacterized protein PV09_06965 [Verruconis gallopava]KIW01793.1 hypothetical protein PV09_06965 [Verruconis gallopava]